MAFLAEALPMVFVSANQHDQWCESPLAGVTKAIELDEVGAF